MHSAFLHRCLELAEHGRRKVSPNPLVGCVIVKEGQVLTEGWHEEFGSEHAEVMALKKAGDLAHGATLYVNLEPCCTQGKQPPCTDAIIKAGIKTVVFGAQDSSNRGGKVLQNADIEVISPQSFVETPKRASRQKQKQQTFQAMESECRRLNKGFFSLIENGRPWVTIKKAIKRDGSYTGKITSEDQDAWSYARLRGTHDAILVGAGTVVADDPKLNIRIPLSPFPFPLSPRRIILDPHSRVPPTSHVLTDSDAERTIVIREKLRIPELLERIKDEGIASVLVEGGPGVWKSFEESGLIDEMVTLTPPS